MTDRPISLYHATQRSYICLKIQQTDYSVTLNFYQNLSQQIDDLKTYTLLNCL